MPLVRVLLREILVRGVVISTCQKEGVYEEGFRGESCSRGEKAWCRRQQHICAYISKEKTYRL